MPDHRFQLSEETTRLVHYLRSLEKGETVEYAELSKLVGVQVDARHGKLTYARRILERDHSAVWICLRPKVGIRRLTDVEIAERLPTWWLNGARNKLRRGGDQSEVVELKALDIDQQTRFAVDVLQQQLAFDALSKASRRKLEKVSRGNSNDLPTFSAVEWAFHLSPRVQRK